MRNELLLIVSIFVIYSSVLVSFFLFKKSGLKAFTVLATITANIEVLILIDAFGFEQTLGNVLFASTFLITDILSEVYGKKEANKAVNIGIFTSALFLVFSQLWLLYIPSQNDFIFSHIESVFSNTPRLIFASLAVYAISQKLDVWAYHKWWALTDKRFGAHDKFLWLRNNGSTMISQLLNAMLFTFTAFWGVHEVSTILSIAFTSYAIYFIVALLDTPIVYIARWYSRKRDDIL